VKKQPRHHGAHDDTGDGRGREIVLLAGERVLREHGEHQDPDAGMLPDRFCVRTW
jgi:hypothetical protein